MSDSSSGQQPSYSSNSSQSQQPSQRRQCLQISSASNSSLQTEQIISVSVCGCTPSPCVLSACSTRPTCEKDVESRERAEQHAVELEGYKHSSSDFERTRRACIRASICTDEI